MYSQDIRMEFSIEKYTMLIRRRGKRHTTKGIELPNVEKFRMLGEKETYKYLGILEANTIKQVKRNEKHIKNHLRRTKKLLETTL